MSPASGDFLSLLLSDSQRGENVFCDIMKDLRSGRLLGGRLPPHLSPARHTCKINKKMPAFKVLEQKISQSYLHSPCSKYSSFSLLKYRHFQKLFWSLLLHLIWMLKTHFPNTSEKFSEFFVFNAKNYSYYCPSRRGFKKPTHAYDDLFCYFNHLLKPQKKA